MATPEFANQFTQEWLRSWNAHGLDAILSHYADDFEMIFPYIVAITRQPSGTLKSKKLIGKYWDEALSKYPKLHFDLCNVLIGVQSIVIYYK